MRSVSTVDARRLLRAFNRWATCKEFLNLADVVCVLVLWVVLTGCEESIVHGWILMASYHLIVGKLGLIKLVRELVWAICAIKNLHHEVGDVLALIDSSSGPMLVIGVTSMPIHDHLVIKP